MSSTYAGANSFPTNITIPSDGDDVDGSSVNAGFEGLADRTVYNKAAHDALVASVASEVATIDATFADRKPSHKLVEIKSVSVLDNNEGEPQHAVWNSASYGTPVSLATFVQNAAVGDLVEVSLSGHCAEANATGSAKQAWLRLEASQNGGGYAEIAGAKTMFEGEDTAGVPTVFPFEVHACFTVASAGALAIRVQGRQNGGGVGTALIFQGAYAFVGKIWRPEP